MVPAFVRLSIAASFSFSLIPLPADALAQAGAPQRPVATIKPGRAIAPLSEKIPVPATAGLVCEQLVISQTEFPLPALDASAVLTVRNTSLSPIVIVKPELGFHHESGNGRRDISASVYVEPDESNQWMIAPGASTTLRFKVQFLNDVPPGRINVTPRITWFSQADNALPALALQPDAAPGPPKDSEEAGARWTVDNPTASFNASATTFKDESLPLGGEGAVRLDVKDSKLRGRITLQSPLGRIRPDAEYVAGAFCKSDRSGWDSPINKGASVVEYDAEGAVSGHEIHVFEIPSWNWHITRFKSDARTSRAAMAVWNRGWAVGQTGQSWYGAAFVLPKDKLHVLSAASSPSATVALAPAAQQSIVFLGDDRPKANDGGNWIGRYGSESFILSAMRAPQDIVGGRFLPRRRWAGGKSGFAPTSVAWTENKGDLFYEVLTGDPREEARHWTPAKELMTPQSRALVNPLEGGRRYGSWDDRGELHPFDGKGPDLIVNLEIPTGLHRLSLYFIDWDFYDTERPRTHRLFISDATQDEKAGLLNSGFVSDFGQGVYKVYGVTGPCKLRLRVQKDRSVCSVLSGVFLDDISMPAIDPPLLSGLRLSATLQKAVTSYNQLRSLSQRSPSHFLNTGELMRQLIRLVDESPVQGNNERALTAWLRWRCTGSLLVAPSAREAAFRELLAARPPQTSAQAERLLQGLVAQGQLAEAHAVVRVWLGQEQAELWARGGRADGSSASSDISKLLHLFAGRDPDFAARQAALWVAKLKARGQKPDVALAMARDLAIETRKEASGASTTDIKFRSVVALYDAIEQVYGPSGLGETGAFRRAVAIASSPGFASSTSRLALEAYEKYLARWPHGRHTQQAYMAVVQYGIALGGASQPQARNYSDLSALAARALLARADAKLAADAEQARWEMKKTTSTIGIQAVSAPIPAAKFAKGSVAVSATHKINDEDLPNLEPDSLPAETAALFAAWSMAHYCTGIGDTVQANEWYGEIVKRDPESEIGKSAAALIKKAEAQGTK